MPIRELLTVDQEKCVRCGLCVADCPACILSMGENGPQCLFDRGCMSCGHCVAICPNGALENKYTPAEKMVPVPKTVFAPKDAYEFLRSRRSVRLFKDKAPQKEEILRLLDIARYAPTAGNSQGLYYTVITGRDNIRAIAEATACWMEDEVAAATENKRYFEAVLRAYRQRGQDIIARNAPMLIFVSARRLSLTGVSNAEQALSYASLFAPCLGLGTTMAGFIQSCGIAGYGPLLELVGTAPKQKIVGCMMVGYPKVRYRLMPERQHLKCEFRGDFVESEKEVSEDIDRMQMLED